MLNYVFNPLVVNTYPYPNSYANTRLTFNITFTLVHICRHINSFSNGKYNANTHTHTHTTHTHTHTHTHDQVFTDMTLFTDMTKY